MRPMVEDEVRRNLFFFEAVLYDAVPEVLEELERCFEVRAGGRELSFGSWAGSDMDGHPEVGAETLARTLTLHRESALRLLYLRVDRLAQRFSHARRRVPVSPALLDSLERDAADLPSARVLRRANRDHEPLRTKLGFITRRILNMRDPLAREPGYADPQELRDDLWLVLDSVGSEHVAHGEIRRLLWQVDVFGFHVASLDVRQSASVVQEAVATLLPGYRDADDGERRRLLEEAITEGRRGMGGRPDGVAGELLRVLDTVALAREAYGPRAVPVMVISMARSPADVLAALWLVRRAGARLRLAAAVRDARGPDRRAADDGCALRHAGLPRLAPRARRPAIDHARLLGLRQGLRLRLEPVGAARGAGAARRAGRRGRAGAGVVPRARRLAVAGRRARAPRDPLPAARLAQRADPDHGAGRGHLRALRRSRARRALARADDVRRAPGLDARAAAVPGAWRDEMERTAKRSRDRYRALVYGDPDFARFFEQFTPIAELTSLNIGSRPSKRASGGIEALRAIPWVFAWTQNRLLLPSWYGAGAALAEGPLETERARPRAGPSTRGCSPRWRWRSTRRTWASPSATCGWSSRSSASASGPTSRASSSRSSRGCWRSAAARAARPAGAAAPALAPQPVDRPALASPGRAPGARPRRPCRRARPAAGDDHRDRRRMRNTG